MSFQYIKDVMHVEDVSVPDLVEKYGTPVYLYSRKRLEKNYQAFADAFAHQYHEIFYAVKANSNLAILNLLARMGCGFDIVSRGELERVLKAGGKPEKIIFSGVGKTCDEIKRAIDVNIFCFNVESVPELERIEHLAYLAKKKVNVCLRVNPNIDALTHPFITTGRDDNKFGIPIMEVDRACEILLDSHHLNVVGLAVHIGSQISSTKPYEAAVNALLAVSEQLEKKFKFKFKIINLGGGFAVKYNGEPVACITEHAKSILKAINHKFYKLFLEPGRIIVADAGILVTRVQYIKTAPKQNFAVVDTGMHHLLRPAFYDAWHAIREVNNRMSVEMEKLYDIVGPICETSDYLGKQRKLRIKGGDLLAIMHAGAYGFTMSSNYNSHVRPAEVMVDGTKSYLIRQREMYNELYYKEAVLP